MSRFSNGTRPTYVRHASIGLLCAMVFVSLATVSAHVVKSLGSGGLASAFVSSPSGGSDAPITIGWGTSSQQDTGLRVLCFYVANTSAGRLDRGAWPRITGVGFELPGSPSGFALIAPLDGGWELVEGSDVSIPGHASVTLDFAIIARVIPTGTATGLPHDLGGIPPDQEGVRGSGTRFCVSGPLPDRLPDLSTPDDPSDTVATTIEGLINGIVVTFGGVAGSQQGIDAGVWFPPPGTAPRAIPLYQ